MKKVIATSVVWVVLFLILIISPITSNVIEKKDVKESVDDLPNYTVTGVNSLENNNKTAIITDRVTVDRNLAQYGANTCTETLIFKFIREPGVSLEVINGADKQRNIIHQTNTIKSGQGFDATITLTATLGGAGCPTSSNYQKLLTKLTNKKALKVFFSSSEDVAVGFGNTASIVYQYDDKRLPVIANNTPLTLYLQLPTAYYDEETGQTTYSGQLNGWKALKNPGYFYTNINTCPKSDVNGNPLMQYYIVEYVYDLTDGANLTNANGEPLYPVRYGRNNGQYYLAQELLVSSSRGACLSDDFNRMTNNFHFTQIDLKDPFNNDKFPADSLLNWTGLWKSDLTPEQNWLNIAGGKKYQPVIVDFNSDKGIEDMRLLKKLYEDDPSIEMNNYSDAFKKFIIDNNQYK